MNRAAGLALTATDEGNVESGFEIWHGGTGLATKSFSADIRT